MGLVDNPLFSAIGEHLGLGEIFDQARGTSAAPSGTPVRPAASKPNIPEYRNRPYIPRQMPGMTGAQAAGGTNPITPGTMDPATLQNNAALLGQYGVQPPQNPPDPNLFIHNPEAFARHPLIAGLLEHGLEGLAYAHPGANAFESLIGGIRGMQEAQAARASQVNAQVMAPVQQAQMIQQLQKNSDEHNSAQSEIDYKRGLLEHYKYLDQQPRFDTKTGQPLYPHTGPDGQITYDQPDPHWREAPYDQLRRQFYERRINELTSKYGTLDKVPSDEIMNVLTGAESSESNAKGANATKNTLIKAEASKENTRTRAAASERNASLRGQGGSSKWAESDRKEYSDNNRLDSQLNQAYNKAIGAMKPFPVIDPKTNKEVIAVPGSSLHKDYVEGLLNQRKQLAARQASIRNKYQGSNTAPSAAPVAAPMGYSSDNKYAH